MAADVELKEWNGAAPGTPTDKTSGTILFQDYDRHQTTLLYPIIRPTIGIPNLSFEKWLRLYIGVTPPVGSITSPRAFSDESGFGVGIGLKAGVTGSYVQPAKTTSVFATVDFFTYSDASPLDMDVNTTPPYSGALVDIADFLVLQASVESTAIVGLTNPETLTIAFDET